MECQFAAYAFYLFYLYTTHFELSLSLFGESSNVSTSWKGTLGTEPAGRETGEFIEMTEETIGSEGRTNRRYDNSILS